MFKCVEEGRVDYDLVSAYTTTKAHLSLPSYSKGQFINPDDLDAWST